MAQRQEPVGPPREPADLDDVLGRLKVITSELALLRKYSGFLVVVVFLLALGLLAVLTGTVSIDVKPVR